MPYSADIHSTRILIIDDCCDTASMLYELMSAKGYGNVSWTTDVEAIPFLRQVKQYGLILLDMHMPAMSGMQFLDQLHTTQPESCVPVIAISGDQRYRTVAMEAGASAFLLKPFDFDEVEAAILNALFFHYGWITKSVARDGCPHPYRRLPSGGGSDHRP
jgi:CheY-like chemotaxis protein